MEENLDIHALSPHLHSPEAAIEYLERLRWPNGPVCPHCGETERKPYLLKSRTRRKLWKCAACRKQFTVTVGTIFEDSHIPLTSGCSPSTCSARQEGHERPPASPDARRDLQVRLVHVPPDPVRDGSSPPFARLLSGTVEADETYVGGKARATTSARADEAAEAGKKTGRGTDKTPVLVLVERGGEARSFRMANVTGDTQGRDPPGTSPAKRADMTDSFASYKRSPGVREPRNRQPRRRVRPRRRSHEHGRELLLDPQARHQRHLPPRQRGAPAPLPGGVRLPLQHSRR